MVVKSNKKERKKSVKKKKAQPDKNALDNIETKIKKESKIKKTKTDETSSCNKNLVYLDNVNISMICPSAEKCYKKNIQIPVSKIAQDKIVDDAKAYILKTCNALPDKYDIFFTSGELESNNIILCCAVHAYQKIRQIKPHVVISSAEHDSIITYAQSLLDSNQIELTIVKTNSYGCVLSDSIISAVRPNTCLVSVTYINHELGSVNNISTISEALHAKKIPLHSNCTYLFGKHVLDLDKTHMDASTISFDKINGPIGVGALIINKDFSNGYKLYDHSSTLKNKRTPNIPAIMASVEAIKMITLNRKNKNKKILKYRNDIISKLGQKYQTLTFANFMKSDEPPLEKTTASKTRIVILGPPLDNVAYYTPSILSILIINAKNKNNVTIKKELEKKGIVIGTPDLEYMYKELGIPDEAQQYIIRISIPDSITQDDITKFINVLKSIV